MVDERPSRTSNASLSPLPLPRNSVRHSGGFSSHKDHSKALPPVSTMADQLAKLGLISKVCTELEKHIGIGDKNLAEFVLHLAKESKYDRNAFSKSLKANGANFPDALFETLYTIICAKKVSHGEKNTTKNQGSHSSSNSAIRMSYGAAPPPPSSISTARKSYDL